MATNLDTTVQDIRLQFLRMMSMVVEQLTTLRTAILDGEYSHLAERLSELDADVDAMEQQLEVACLKGLALQSPVARDLRFFLLIFKSLADLERAGDYAKHIGREISESSPSLQRTNLLDIANALLVLLEMVDRLSYAFLEQDLEAAAQVVTLDDSIDAQYEQMQRVGMTLLLEHPMEIAHTLRISRLGREIERLGDHLKNIAARILIDARSAPLRSSV